MNYLKNRLVIENIESGRKTFVNTFDDFLRLDSTDKSLARTFINSGQALTMGKMVVRKPESFELIL